MKKNSKKRVLLSSVAMLMVGAVSLGTATYAWFTQTTEATADGIYAKSVKSSSLVLSKNDHAWNTAITYTQGTAEAAMKMLPASSGDGSKWFTAVSDNATTGAAKTITAVPSTGIASSNAKYVLKQELNVKNDGTDGTIKNVTIAWTYPTKDLADYVRVAIVPKAAKIATDANGIEETGNNIITANGAFKDNVYAPSQDTYDGLTKTDGTGSVSITTKTAQSITVGDLDAQNYASYDLYMWFEGQDTACVDANVGQMLNGIVFTVTGEPA